MKKISKSEEEWKDGLSDVQFNVTRKKHTEKPFSGEYWDHKGRGVYHCICCGAELFQSSSKFDSGCGWPSFCEPMDKENLEEVVDTSYNMIRTEVICTQCDAHLGHVFTDGPAPKGTRYCINSASLYFEKSGDGETDDIPEIENIEDADTEFPDFPGE